MTRGNFVLALLLAAGMAMHGDWATVVEVLNV